METVSAMENEWTMDGDGLPYQRSLRTTAYQFTRDPDAAEDLVQETYLKAFRHFSQFKPGTNLRAWLFMIMRNSFINQYRRRSFESLRFHPADVDVDTLPSGPMAPDRAFPADGAGPELDDEIREALDSLPEEYRSVVVLRDLEQHSYKEIARIEGIPAGTVMSRLYRGRKMLEGALMAYGRRRGYLRNPGTLKRRDKSLPAA